MHYTIYKITNKINNKYYIGKHQTNDLNDDYMGSGKLIQRAIQKYGIENFSKEILFDFDNEEDMNNKELELVVLSEDSYNLCPGGQGGFGYINVNPKFLTQKRLEALSDNSFGTKKLKELYRTDSKFNLKMADIRNKAVAALKVKYPEGTFKGKKHSEETKKKMSEIDRSGINNSQYGTFWITNGILNKKCKEEIPEGWYKGRTIK